MNQIKINKQFNPQQQEQEQKQLPPLPTQTNLSQNKMIQIFQQQQKQQQQQIKNYNMNYIQQQQQQAQSYLKLQNPRQGSLLLLEQQKQQQQNLLLQQQQLEKINNQQQKQSQKEGDVQNNQNQSQFKVNKPLKKLNTIQPENLQNNINSRQSISNIPEQFNNIDNKYSISVQDLEKIQKCKQLTQYGQQEIKQEPKPTVSSKSWAVFELETMKYIDGKSAYGQREVASLTKIMTFYTTLRIIEKYNLRCKDITFYVSRWASKITGTTAKLKSDMEITLYDLFFGIMLPSGNDAAFCVAENMGAFLYLNKEDKDIIYNKDEFREEVEDVKGPVYRFLQQMNKYGQELEIASNYANPHGLMHKENKSSASDVAKLSCKALQYPLFREVVKTINHSCQVMRNGKQLKLEWENTNKLLLKGKRFFGLKTGITDSAGPCLATSVFYYDSFAKIDRNYVVVILSCKSMDARWKETEKIAEWAHRRTCQKYKEQYFNEFINKKGINISQLKMNLIKLKQQNILKQENLKNQKLIQKNQTAQNLESNSQQQQQFQKIKQNSQNNSQMQNSYNQLPTDDTNNQDLTSMENQQDDCSPNSYSQYSDSDQENGEEYEEDIEEYGKNVQNYYQNSSFSDNSDDDGEEGQLDKKSIQNNIYSKKVLNSDQNLDLEFKSGKHFDLYSKE